MVRFTLFLFLLLPAVFVTGQMNEWTSFTFTDNIRDMAEDGDYLWLGTTGGLIRYNKLDSTSVHYNKANSSLPSNSITALSIDGNGSLWIGTTSGLTVHNGKRWSTFTADNSILPSSYINDIAMGDDGTVYIGTGNGLVTRHSVNWTVFQLYPNHTSQSGRVSAILPLGGDTVWLASTGPKLFKMAGAAIIDSIVIVGLSSWYPINSLYEDTNGDLLISSDKGLFRYSGDSIATFNQTNSPLPINHTHFTFRDSDGSFFIATCSHGLIKAEDTVWTEFNPIHSGIDFGCITSVVKIQPGRFWIASANSGLLEFDNGTWTQHQTANWPMGNVYEDIRAITTDHTGTTWLGTNNGIYGYHNHEWTCIPFHDSLVYHNSDLGITHLVVDQNNVLWAMNWSALLRVDNGSYTIINQSNWPPLQGFFRSLAVGPDGYLYFTHGTDLCRYDGTTCVVLDNTNSGFPGGSIPFLSTDRNGVLWITDYGKVTRYDGHSWTTWDQSNSPLPLVHYYTAVTDSAGVLWIGGDDSGLVRFDGTNWDFYTRHNSDFPYHRINQLAVDHDNNLWVTGTSAPFYTVIKVDSEGTFTPFTYTNSPLSGYTVRSLHVDPFNNKWFGMSRGRGVTIHNSSGLILAMPPPVFAQSPVAEVWPNPFSEAFRVALPGYCSDCFYQVRDMQGRLAMEGELRGDQARINTSSLAPGVYIFTVTGSNIKTAQKIVKRY